MRFCLPFVSDLLISVKNVTNIVKISIIIANFVAKIVVKVVTGDKDCDDGSPLPLRLAGLLLPSHAPTPLTYKYI